MKASSTTLVLGLALSLSGCFIVSRPPPTSSRSQPQTGAPPKNYGQQRSQEVHERNAERKAAKDAAKGK